MAGNGGDNKHSLSPNASDSDVHQRHTFSMAGEVRRIHLVDFALHGRRGRTRPKEALIQMRLMPLKPKQAPPQRNLM